ncbi:LysR family transcriptional regulator [Novilysobacter spongiicola]|uniref:DNA-binding transcriptional regulator, LysR family n=1 Tax=Lysobacter spongiicola DSM 21749 TaxID=1122188 RepID=A0A1T4Q8X1_9GAMM|nr:LysR family transcriptional regulator [Lysobacter spongiicola]SKA00203.1 DNA-binding transcriptional regulator, LysR family [Lysobacter spongiicola DSM 21749]
MPSRRPASPRFSYKGDRLKPLRAFCQTVRLGSISRAAEALFLSQPAVTLQLQALERDMGVRLIERSGRRWVMTPEGEALYELARPLVEGVDGLDTVFRERIRGLDAGELNIAAGSSTILYLLPRVVEAFRTAYPEVRLNLHNVTGASGLELLRSDAVDFAVGSMLDVPADLDYAPVAQFDPMLITPLDHPLARRRSPTLEDLSPYGLILPPQRLTTYRLVDLVFQRARVPYTVALEVGGWEVIKQYVAMGMGISIVTAICLGEADRTRLAARSLASYFPRRSYGVVVRKGKYLSPQARAFTELIRPDLFTREGPSSNATASER